MCVFLFRYCSEFECVCRFLMIRAGYCGNLRFAISSATCSMSTPLLSTRWVTFWLAMKLLSMHSINRAGFCTRFLTLLRCCNPWPLLSNGFQLSARLRCALTRLAAFSCATITTIRFASSLCDRWCLFFDARIVFQRVPNSK